MSISTQLTRLAQNVGAINADTNAIFEALRAKGVDVLANAQLSDVADMIESIVIPHQNEVEIGGRWYPYVQIGNKLWTTESLKNPTSNSYQPNETDKYGLLYPYADFTSINNLLPEGWRIPTKSDFEDLITICGDVGSNYISEEFGGDNTNGFNACLLGYVNQSGQYLNYGNRGYLWTSTDYTSSEYLWNVWYQPSAFGVDDYANKNTTKLQIRLVKDVT